MIYSKNTKLTLRATFRLKADDTPADPSTITLALTDPLGVVYEYEYGVDAQPTRVSEGVYEFALETHDLLAGQWYYEWNGTGAAIAAGAGDFQVATSTADAYCTDDDLDQLYGRTNVDKWADLESNEVAAEIRSRRAWARVEASREIDDRLRNGPYPVPLARPIPRTIARLAAQYAGVLLYESRGIQDVNPETGQAIHRLSWHRKEFSKRIVALHAGQLEPPIENETTSYPRVV
jgi:phage gp36-like protein